ncbi:hypothetical protein [Enterococcus durans]|uniref:hypothetical protein n=1 Tax=Enterococcus durans TaxID=53345 RepID=UPI001E3F3B3C|nr:hypothetical protein [Enterococcus durans]
MNVSEDEKALTDAYYWLSMYKSGAITEGVAMEKVKEAMLKQPQLNDNQKIVLEWLKLTAPTGKPMQVVFWMMNNAAWGHLDELRDPLMELTDKEQFEVLTAFAQWGLEQEEAG